jgi:hypothetical protein
MADAAVLHGDIVSSLIGWLDSTNRHVHWKAASVVGEMGEQAAKNTGLTHALAIPFLQPGSAVASGVSNDRHVAEFILKKWASKGVYVRYGSEDRWQGQTIEELSSRMNTNGCGDSPAPSSAKAL